MPDKKQKTSLAVAVVLIALVLVGNKISSTIPSDLSGESIIPRPASILSTGNYFTIDERTGIYIEDGNEEVRQVAEYLSDKLSPATGYDISVLTTGSKPGKGNIYLTLAGEKDDNESYELNITKKLVTLSAASPAGLFMGIQTLRQLLPARIEVSTEQEGPCKIATGTITDN